MRLKWLFAFTFYEPHKPHACCKSSLPSTNRTTTAELRYCNDIRTISANCQYASNMPLCVARVSDVQLPANRITCFGGPKPRVSPGGGSPGQMRNYRRHHIESSFETSILKQRPRCLVGVSLASRWRLRLVATVVDASTLCDSFSVWDHAQTEAWFHNFLHRSHLSSWVTKLSPHLRIN